jgi:hypothetical protein
MDAMLYVTYTYASLLAVVLILVYSLRSACVSLQRLCFPSLLVELCFGCNSISPFDCIFLASFQYLVCTFNY